jgi:hypothetical protein
MVSLATILFMLISEPALALNVEKIGKGVVGDSRMKASHLKEFVFYVGIFFIVLGSIVTLYRKKKFNLQKRSDTSNAAGPFLIVFGLLMASVKLWG